MLKLTQLIRQTTLPLATFESLRQLWYQISQAISEECFFITETTLSSTTESSLNYFTVVISEKFSALLIGNWDLDSDRTSDAKIHPPPDSITSETLLRVEISFAPDAIASFLNDLAGMMPHNAILIEPAKSRLQPNDAGLQSQFTVALIEILTKSSHLTSFSPDLAVCRPIEAALQQQIEQESLLNQVISQIRRSLEVPVILETAVQQVRQLLQTDRLVIFEFDLPENYQELSLKDLERNCQVGKVTYEARSTENITSVVSCGEPDRCFIRAPHVLAKYHRGVTQAVSNVETVYALTPCFLDWMRQIQVKAKLVAPIIVEEKLWGLLIAHQCDRPREWKLSEQQFLLLIAEHLAVAIQQAQLYTQVQQQAQTLEQRVIERTQELQDALVVAEAASRAKGQFLATMSHELKTPLTSIIGLSDTLLRWSSDELKEKQQLYLQIIRDRGQHLQEIIDDILDLSDLETKELTLNISEISLQQIAKQSLKMVERNATNNGVELALELRISRKNATFKADYRRLTRILVNLLSNGIKFTPKGGKVTLRIWLETDKSVFQVEDTGIGIPESQQHLLFQKFQQLDSAYTRQYQGMGMGLALTKQLVELHQGKIDLRSTVGVGSIFTVSLPRLTNHQL
ncbi:sensor histidine kinase [Merismopedia glauca]|uniref:histidine kinase n=1 Tax=Merismopedia glauca CCAP 1448/3 TaxID=1296344 RepID=A0A2T1CA22_9CYAN|nr:GAF domain-containing sensor histidine kinase [Merismopedia glauca]PSB05120.1 ATPase [Merismopedia glauca CCAP 1448/3]